MNNKRVKHIFLIIGLIIMAIWFYFQIRKQGTCKEAENKEFHIEYNGVVIKKYIDKTNHNFEIIEIGNKDQIQKIMMDWDKSGLFEYVKEEDSIIKELNSLEVKVYRNKIVTTFIIDYQCED